MARGTVVWFLALVLLAGCSAGRTDPLPPDPGGSTGSVVSTGTAADHLVVPPLPGPPPPDPREPGVYLVVEPTWSVADYHRIRDEVYDEVGPDGFQAFLLDHLHTLAEGIAIAALTSGYPGAEVVRWYPSPVCLAGGLCPDGEWPTWQVILAGPFSEPPALLLDGTAREWSDDEYAAASAYRDRMLASAFTRPVVGPRGRRAGGRGGRGASPLRPRSADGVVRLTHRGRAG